eukprot:TRINITY_DN24772_c0_g1_i1.p3 TRINITY_DN24772_c0_g1~~TRINITY_DN24772_c0_g1_i1.p3  ORF type:complete len:107 (+),score=24.63 TRINITY_DN24772_c0_g1_i1:464-784(+)
MARHATFVIGGAAEQLRDHALQSFGEHCPYLGLLISGESINDTVDGFRSVIGVPMYSALILSLIHISEPTRPLYISYAVFCLKKKKNNKTNNTTIAKTRHINVSDL